MVPRHSRQSNRLFFCFFKSLSIPLCRYGHGNKKFKVYLDSDASRAILVVVILDTCGGGTWHMLHGQGIPAPQCWKAGTEPRWPAVVAVGAFRSPWWGLTEVTAEMPGAESDVDTAGGRRGWWTAG